MPVLPHELVEEPLYSRVQGVGREAFFSLIHPSQDHNFSVGIPITFLQVALGLLYTLRGILLEVFFDQPLGHRVHNFRIPLLNPAFGKTGSHRSEHSPHFRSEAVVQMVDAVA